MVDSLGRGNQDCDLAVAGMEIREEHLAQGLVFTYPTLLGGEAWPGGCLAAHRSCAGGRAGPPAAAPLLTVQGL